MVPGWDLRSSDAALELAEHHAPFVQAAVGVHPHHAAAMDERAWGAVEALIADPRCAAVGRSVSTSFGTSRRLTPSRQRSSGSWRSRPRGICPCSFMIEMRTMR